MVYCKKCGKNNLKGKFCSACGTGLIRKTTTKVYFIWSLVVIIILLLVTEAIAFFQPTDTENIFGHIKRGTMLLMGIEFCGNNRCNQDELYMCKKDCVWCGDGTCQNEEIGSCYDDCEWCGDGYCQDKESCDSCSKDCGKCKASAYCGDGVCNAGECALGCYKDCSISQCENGVCESQKGENCVTSPNDCRCKFNEKCNRETKSCEVIPCGDGKCDSGENSLSCPNDCKEKYSKVLTDPNKDFSIIFVHGHNPTETDGYSPTTLEEFQDKLVEQGYEDMGIMLPSDYPPKSTKGVWSGKKVSVIVTYYANKYDKLGGVVGPDDNQHITTYSQRLRDVVEVVKHNTGKNKVIIIAHSMGGLVSRSYIKYYGGLESVDKLVTIGTPNHGTYGYIAFGCGNTLAQMAKGCTWDLLFKGDSTFCEKPRNPTPECGDMDARGTFIPVLNNLDETPGQIKYLTIIGLNKNTNTCPNNEKWDDVICSSSVKLEGAENWEYPTSNYDGILHTIMVSPSKAPNVYDKIVQFIKS